MSSPSVIRVSKRYYEKTNAKFVKTNAMKYPELLWITLDKLMREND